MRALFRSAGLLAALALALGAASCGGDDDEGADAGDVSFELRIGHVAPFTGALSDFGPPGDKAAKIAVELIREAVQERELDVTVTYMAEDSQTDATAGVEAATKLVQTDAVNAVIGAWASTVTIPIAESVTVPNQVLQISPASTSPAISLLEDDDYMWRTPPSDAIQGELVARIAAEEFGDDATLNTGTRNDAYGTALIAEFEQNWRDQGGTIGRSVRWNPEAATFDTEAQRLAGGNPDGWVIVDFPETWARFGPALVRAGGWDPERTFTTDGLASDALPGDAGRRATAGMRGTRPSPGGETPAGDAFGRVYGERGDQSIARQTFDAQTFDAVMVAFLAALRAGSSESQAIRDNLRDVSGPPGTQYTFEQLDEAIADLLEGNDIDYEGVSGVINFDENGDPQANGAVYQTWHFEGGNLVEDETFTYPFEDSDG